MMGTRFSASDGTLFFLVNRVNSIYLKKSVPPDAEKVVYHDNAITAETSDIKSDHKIKSRIFQLMILLTNLNYAAFKLCVGNCY